ncbi:MAG TPA: hypothetical protein VN228_00670 [Pyrinomonadaceae bacterium]|nr:hypothetical protein [Pyrinomonadaceae bacterium]
MKIVYARAAALAFALSLFTTAAHAQRPPTPADPSAAPPADRQAAARPATGPVKVKYEGGFLGARKQDGWLSFDDLNRRVIFKSKEQRELFSLSYDALSAAWPDTKSRRSTAGQVIASTVPYGLGLPGLLMKSKSRYLVVQYRDPDTGHEGVTSFKMQDKELVASVLTTLAEKAQLTQRGDAYVRRQGATTTKTTAPE